MSFFERLKTAASAEWRAYTEHPFTNGLADGSLAEAAFRHYLVQDYLFLIEFARAYALSVYKSPKLADMREAAAGLSAILDIEMNLHVKLCAGWGLSRGSEFLDADLECTPLAGQVLPLKLDVDGHITHERIASEPGRSHVRPGRRSHLGPHREGEEP
jgi:thiaminase (transcriptional activator TenA)